MKIDVLLTLSLLGLVSSEAPSPTLMKRGRDALFNKDYKNLLDEKSRGSVSSELPKPWLRTLSDDRVEVVTPTVIGGVTFATKPPMTTNGLEHWISLDKQGQPKTIKPEIKNGIIKKGWPDYKTWFATPTTIIHDNSNLNAHNLGEDELFEEELFLPEDPYEHSLNPLIRCTPERYSKKGSLKVDTSEPFCTPQDNIRWILDKTYFITWYSGFFSKDVENIRLIFSHVKQSAHQKDLKKREGEEVDISLSKRSKEIELGGKVQKSFYVTDWIKNTKGFIPFEIKEEWIGGDDIYQRKVLVTIQPDNIKDEEFDILKNHIVVEFSKGVKVDKSQLVDIKKAEEKKRNKFLGIVDEEEEDWEKYYIIMGLPTCVAVFGLFAYLFVTYNRVDFSHTRNKFAREKTTHRRIPFRRKKESTLPQFNEGTKHD